MKERWQPEKLKGWKLKNKLVSTWLSHRVVQFSILLWNNFHNYNIIIFLKPNREERINCIKIHYKNLMPSKFINLGITATFIYINDTPLSPRRQFLTSYRICYCGVCYISSSKQGAWHNTYRLNRTRFIGQCHTSLF